MVWLPRLFPVLLCRRAGSDPGSRGRREQRFLLRPLAMAVSHQRDITRDGFPGGRFQTSYHTRNSGSKTLLKGNARHSVGAPLRLLRGKEISGISLQTSMLLWSRLQRDVGGICFQMAKPLRHMGCRWLTPSPHRNTAGATASPAPPDQDTG